MFVKVCGITTPQQAHEISQLVDYVGFIFHPGSPRFVSQSYPSMKAKKVGVLVNVPLQELIQTALLEKLDSVQLHGSESPEYCAAMKEQVQVIKSFGVDADFDFDQLKAYEPYVDYFLFDTKTPKHGGSGKQFDWRLLKQYQGATPFILSGGLRPESLPQIQEVNHPKLTGIDLNSGFETQPGIKNLLLLKQFLHDFHN
ncbi:MAG: N-(5'-phosphoribosyl)anthranilate isomerase [Fluviicola sp. XM-24bin1]|nr:MAG: N-(5'-phosphoribosyl)anthranilate isomerase [Fluviicola sp. XM-24bin1]